MRNYEITAATPGFTRDFTREAAPATASLTGADRELERPGVSRFSAVVPEESLVEDGRSRVTPAQMVESKLMTLLQGSSLPVSHLQMRGLVRNYRQS